MSSSLETSKIWLGKQSPAYFIIGFKHNHRRSIPAQYDIAFDYANKAEEVYEKTVAFAGFRVFCLSGELMTQEEWIEKRQKHFADKTEEEELAELERLQNKYKK